MSLFGMYAIGVHDIDQLREVMFFLTDVQPKLAEEDARQADLHAKRLSRLLRDLQGLPS